jgi:hypothetical protein
MFLRSKGDEVGSCRSGCGVVGGVILELKSRRGACCIFLREYFNGGRASVKQYVWSSCNLGSKFGFDGTAFVAIFAFGVVSSRQTKGKKGKRRGLNCRSVGAVFDDSATDRPRCAYKLQLSTQHKVNIFKWLWSN